MSERDDTCVLEDDRYELLHFGEKKRFVQRGVCGRKEDHEPHMRNCFRIVTFGISKEDGDGHGPFWCHGKGIE